LFPAPNTISKIPKIPFPLKMKIWMHSGKIDYCVPDIKIRKQKIKISLQIKKSGI